MTGNMPGIAASTSETCELGAPPNSVEAPENSFDLDVTWAWTSMPITTSQSPVAPLISLWGVADALMISNSGRNDRDELGFAHCTASVKRRTSGGPAATAHVNQPGLIMAKD